MVYTLFTENIWHWCMSHTIILQVVFVFIPMIYILIQSMRDDPKMHSYLPSFARPAKRGLA